MATMSNGLDFIRNQVNAEIIDMNNPKCIDCNDCCSMGTLLTDEEYKMLRKYLIKNKDFYNRAIRMIRGYKEKGIIYYLCPFSTSLKTCRIYKIRPQICRDFHCTESLRAANLDKDHKPHSILELFYDGFR